MFREEQRMTGLLRELVQHHGALPEVLDARLGWESGRLSQLLSQGIGFEELLEVLAELDVTPGDFFARLNDWGGNGKNGSRRADSEDHRFEESRRVIKAALARRSARKESGST